MRQLTPGGWLLASAFIALTALIGGPARADKAITVTVEPWRFLAGLPPVGWTEPGFDDRGWGGPAVGPFSPRPSNASSVPPGTLYDLVPRAPLLLRARVSVADAAHVRVLELRVAYNDAFVAYLDGHEIARRGIAPNWTAATVPHGPELERLYIPEVNNQVELVDGESPEEMAVALAQKLRDAKLI